MIWTSTEIEIEKQVQDMLAKGLIQDITSPFASPVILVCKKDGTWQFYVDYIGSYNTTNYPSSSASAPLHSHNWITSVMSSAGRG
jgi:hypothetical protein